MLVQKNHLLAITTSIKLDVLTARWILVREQLSRLFQIEARLIGQRCSELKRGARTVDARITMPSESGLGFLSRLGVGREIKRVHVTAKDDAFAFD